MKSGSYFIVLLLAVAGVVLTAALILMARTNQRLQVQLQAQQQTLNQGILGQQAQQISSGVLQDMAGAAVDNAGIRKLLEQYGYHVAPARNATPSVTGGPAKSPAPVSKPQPVSKNIEAPTP